jgi:hypothetical protein
MRWWLAIVWKSAGSGRRSEGTASSAEAQPENRRPDLGPGQDRACLQGRQGDAGSGEPEGAGDDAVSDDPFLEAVEALRAIGLYVEPTGDDLSLWLVNGEELTDTGLIKLAALLGLVSGSATIQ